MREQDTATYLTDPKQELLRQNLMIAREFLSDKHLLNLISGLDKSSDEDSENSRRNNHLTLDRFRKVISNFTSNSAERRTRNLNFNYLKPLSDILIETPIIRGLRYLKTGRASMLDNLTASFTHGYSPPPQDTNFEGLYFVYYGSYVSSEHYCIRTVEIRNDPDGFYSVTDDIHDWLKFGGRLLSSQGIMTFFKDIPQLVLIPKKNNETKAGFTFMTGVSPTITGREEFMESMCGVFSTLIGIDTVATRAFAMRRENHLSKSEMIARSRAYSLAELSNSEMEMHRSAFNELKRSMPKASIDPMNAYVLS